MLSQFSEVHPDPTLQNQNYPHIYQIPIMDNRQPESVRKLSPSLQYEYAIFTPYFSDNESKIRL